jgi:hypothetical protein
VVSAGLDPVTPVVVVEALGRLVVVPVVEVVADGGVVAVVVEPVPGVVDEPLGSVVALAVPVLVGLVVLVVLAGVGSVVPANAAPGRTRAIPRVRARAAAGRALQRVRCMVPLQCERCRDGCTGTRT